MQGQILNASRAGNQGVILGDDGVQYSFAATDWRDNSVKATSYTRPQVLEQKIRELSYRRVFYSRRQTTSLDSVRNDPGDADAE